MFAAFALSDEGNNFLRNKPDNKDPEKLKRILNMKIKKLIRQTTVSFTTINVYMNTGKLELQFELGYSLLEY